MEYAVFDDVSIKHTPGWKSWFGAQAEVGLRQLHRDAVYMKWGKPIIWNCNRDPRIDMRMSINKEDGHFFEDDVEWLEANAIFVYIGEPIFRANTE